MEVSFGIDYYNAHAEISLTYPNTLLLMNVECEVTSELYFNTLIIKLP